MANEGGQGGNTYNNITINLPPGSSRETANQAGAAVSHALQRAAMRNG